MRGRVGFEVRLWDERMTVRIEAEDCGYVSQCQSVYYTMA